jgi:uncharacterized 2Fe-2S/4Fe-4S cluster protein (DUF4445 family)
MGREEEIKVSFEPSGRSVYVLPGTILLEAAARAGHVIETPCGGAGKCGKCTVRITAGQSDPTDAERAVLTERRLADGYRLACQSRVASPLTVEIPETSLFQSAQKILVRGPDDRLEVEPAARKLLLEMDPPAQGSGCSDVERLRQALGPVTLDLPVIRRLPQVLREGAFKVTATVVDNTVVDIAPGDTRGTCCGLAFDVGTTTLVGTLIDLADGVDLAVASAINPQTAFGDDVLARIKTCREEPDGLERLHSAVLEAVNAIAGEVARSAGVERHSICEAVFAGNTTMQQILCGIHPLALGEIPFIPAFRELLRTRASELGLDIHPGAAVSVLPQIGGFVGGDTVAGIVATRLDGFREPALLVDVGTNGEIVLAHGGRLAATSVAAGPAFEGARIVSGMRATSGAIEKVVVDGDIRLNVIGNARPAGICGTGLIDAVANLLALGVLDPTGRIRGPGEPDASLPAPIAERVVGHDGQYAFVLARAEESATGEPVRLYQRDIRELQLANAAIRAGIAVLLDAAGLEARDLGCVLLAGAFGNFIRRSSAVRVGMLPPIERHRIRFVGNTASFGAKRVLLSVNERDYASRVGRATRHVDLSLDPAFQSRFGECMAFPPP